MLQILQQEKNELISFIEENLKAVSPIPRTSSSQNEESKEEKEYKELLRDQNERLKERCIALEQENQFLKARVDQNEKNFQKEKNELISRLRDSEAEIKQEKTKWKLDESQKNQDDLVLLREKIAEEKQKVKKLEAQLKNEKNLGNFKRIMEAVDIKKGGYFD